jgi:hypothetical protein
MRTLAFLVLRRLLGMVGCGPAPDAKDVEIAVLRHQLASDTCHAREAAPPESVADLSDNPLDAASVAP